MGYLFTQMFLWLVVAAGSGLLTGWLIWGRNQEAKSDANEECDHLRSSLNSVHAELDACREKLSASEQTKVSAAQAEPEPTPQPEQASEPESTPETLAEGEPAPDDWRPEQLAEPQGEKDDLQTIKGIGPKIEETLHALGIYHFSQIAAFTDENVVWVNRYMSFKGRIQREKWIEQAKQLVGEK